MKDYKKCAFYSKSQEICTAHSPLQRCRIKDKKFCKVYREDMSEKARIKRCKYRTRTTTYHHNKNNPIKNKFCADKSRECELESCSLWVNKKSKFNEMLK